MAFFQVKKVSTHQAHHLFHLEHVHDLSHCYHKVITLDIALRPNNLSLG